LVKYCSLAIGEGCGKGLDFKKEYEWRSLLNNNNLIIINNNNK
jgi:hypothetical protein